MVVRGMLWVRNNFHTLRIQGFAQTMNHRSNPTLKSDGIGIQKNPTFTLGYGFKCFKVDPSNRKKQNSNWCIYPSNATTSPPKHPFGKKALLGDK